MKANPVHGGGRALGVLAVVGIATAFLFSACGGDREVYPMRGQLYDTDADCLSTSDVIDVVEGTPPEGCEGSFCLRSVESGDLFVTAHCTTPPGWTSEDPDAGSECEAALAAKDLGDDGLCPSPT